jgi:hypothetical protein
VTVAERFWAKVDRSAADECWPWMAARFDNNYGAFWRDGRQQRASRVAWELEHGPIPPGMLVCHRCDNPPCVRPDHLFLGTDTDNKRDMAEKGRAAQGDANGARLRPERLARGDRNGARLHPETRARGDRNWAHLHPELTSFHGETHPKAKLTADKVRAIRERYDAGETCSALGREFGTTEEAIRMAVRRITWRHVS